MNAVRKQMDGFAVGLMLLLCVIWGLQQVAIKVAAHDIVPLMQVALRSGISALLVWLFMLLKRQPLTAKDGTLVPGLAAGTLFASEFLLIAKGLGFTSASHMSIFLYTAPIFTALGLHLRLPNERLTPRQWFGIAVAFCGIVTAFAGGVLQEGMNGRTILGDFLGVLAGLGWGATTVVIRCSRLSNAAPAKTLLYQLAAACVLLMSYAAATGQAHAVSMTPIAWGSLLFQAIIVSFASYLTWFWLLTRYLASRLAAFSFMTPLFGVSFGVILLHEPVDHYFAIGAVLVLSGVTLVTLRGTARNEPVVAAAAVSE